MHKYNNISKLLVVSRIPLFVLTTVLYLGCIGFFVTWYLGQNMLNALKSIFFCVGHFLL